MVTVRSSVRSFLIHTRPRSQSPSIKVLRTRAVERGILTHGAEMGIASQILFWRAELRPSDDPRCATAALTRERTSFPSISSGTSRHDHSCGNRTFPTDPTLPGVHHSLTPGSCPNINRSFSHITSLSMSYGNYPTTSTVR